MTPSDWLERRVLVCVGTGGVGKTTVSAALGIEAARRGKRGSGRVGHHLGLQPLARLDFRDF